MNYFKATLIPEKNNQPHPDSFIEHMTNNYYEKFPELDKKIILILEVFVSFKLMKFN